MEHVNRDFVNEGNVFSFHKHYEFSPINNKFKKESSITTKFGLEGIADVIDQYFPSLFLWYIIDK